jgi:hypothetical protein
MGIGAPEIECKEAENDYMRDHICNKIQCVATLIVRCRCELNSPLGAPSFACEPPAVTLPPATPSGRFVIAAEFNERRINND